MYLRLLDADGASISAQRDVVCDDAKETCIGTAPDCALVLPETGAISSVHAIISKTEESWRVTDNGELTPVWINGKALGYGETRDIAPGDMLRISTMTIGFIDDQDARPEVKAKSVADSSETMQIPLMAFQRESASRTPTAPANHRPGDVDHFFGLAHADQARPGNESLLDPLSFFDTPQRAGRTNHSPKGREENSDDALDALLGIKR